MTVTDNELITIFRQLLQAECGIDLTQDEASILSNTLTDFFQVLTLIEHKKECPKKDELEKFLKQKWGNKDIVISITREYIQEFVEANYGRQLTEHELDKLCWLVWEYDDHDLVHWLDAAINQIVKESESKNNHEEKGGRHD